MYSTLNVLLLSHKQSANKQGGNYLKAYQELSEILKNENNIHKHIQLLVEKHDIEISNLGDDYQDFIRILKNFVE